MRANLGRHVCAMVGALVLLLVSEPARAQCEYGWTAGFGAPAPDGLVLGACVSDEGDGPNLFIGGVFSEVGGIDAASVARWDGAYWHALGSGIDGTVYAMIVHDDGSGPAIYAGGDFETAGDVSAANVARWDGHEWSAVGTGLGGGVQHMATFDDGNGPALYASGWFSETGDGEWVPGLARWNGEVWEGVGEPLFFAGAIRVIDDGNGDALYAGGRVGDWELSKPFAGRWDGAVWTPIGTDRGINFEVNGIAWFDAGDGPALYISDGQLRRLDGEYWRVVDDAAKGHMRVLEVVDLAGESQLVMGGFDVARQPTLQTWNGRIWRDLSTDLGLTFDPSGVYALARIDDGDEQTLYLGGRFARTHAPGLSNLAILNSGELTSPEPIQNGASDIIWSLTAHDDGAGSRLYAGGKFRNIGGVAATWIAAWDGREWSAVGERIGNYYDGFVYALKSLDFPDGPTLYAAGFFDIGSDEPVTALVRWDGTSWSAVGGFSTRQYPVVYAIEVFDDGGGPALYVGGMFDAVDEQSIEWLAKWDGAEWHSVGESFDGPVLELIAHDDGNGCALFAAGWFEHAGDVASKGLARWNGEEWQDIAGDFDGSISALCAFDGPGGAGLYIGGGFSRIGGVAARNFARWDGESWHAVGDGVNGWVGALTVLDRGGDRVLGVGGGFTRAGDISAAGVALWDGTTWAPLGDGIGGNEGPAVLAMASRDTSRGSELWVGGKITSAGAVSAGNIGVWSCSERTGVRGDSNCDGAVNFGDITCFTSALVSDSTWWSCQGENRGCDFVAVNDIDGDGRVNFDDIDGFVRCLINDGCP